MKQFATIKKLYLILVRSHSLIFGTLIQTIYKKLQLTHDLSILIPFQYNSSQLFPWKMWDNLTRIPYLFCDYLTAMTFDTRMELLLKRSGLKVFDFHPIHIFLNSENLERYNKTRHLHRKPKELKKLRYRGFGSRSRLIELLEFIKNQ